MKPFRSTTAGLFATLAIAFGLFATLGATILRDAAASDTCKDHARFQAVTIGVPVNGLVSFGVDDLLRTSTDVGTCYEAGALAASVVVAHPAEGRIAISDSSLVRFDGAAAAGQSVRTEFVFQPRDGFTGVSQGWEFHILGTPAGAGAAAIELGTVKVSFMVRNSLPVAADDTVVMTDGLLEVNASANNGLLANDTDPNGDRMTVYSHGITRFAWGTVEIGRDGSYRVQVTNPEAARSVSVRYVVWDNEGSPTSTDTGFLTISFDDGVHDGHTRA